MRVWQVTNREHGSTARCMYMCMWQVANEMILEMNLSPKEVFLGQGETLLPTT